MTPLELQLSVLRATRHFYSWPSIFKSGVADLPHRLPDLARLAHPQAARVLPALARAAWARHWKDVSPLLDLAMPEGPRRRVAHSLWVPALRFHARCQLASWYEQERSQRHLAYLATVGAWGSPASAGNAARGS